MRGKKRGKKRRANAHYKDLTYSTEHSLRNWRVGQHEPTVGRFICNRLSRLWHKNGFPSLNRCPTLFLSFFKTLASLNASWSVLPSGITPTGSPSRRVTTVVQWCAAWRNWTQALSCTYWSSRRVDLFLCPASAWTFNHAPHDYS